MPTGESNHAARFVRSYAKTGQARESNLLGDDLDNDSDPDNHSLTVTGAGPAAHGMVVVNANNTITYTPTSDYEGTDEFQYFISDGHGGTENAMVYITVGQPQLLDRGADGTRKCACYVAHRRTAAAGGGGFE